MIISFNTGKINTTGGKEVALQQKKVTVTKNGLDVVVPDAGYDGLSTVYIKTDVGDGGSSYKDFSVIGYDDELSLSINNEIDDDIAYAQEIYDNWDNTITNIGSKFYKDKKLVYFPSVDTSNIKQLTSAFYQCINLKVVGKLNLSNATSLSNLFYMCTNLKYFDIQGSNLVNVTNIGSAFANNSSLTTVKFGYNLKPTVDFTPTPKLTLESLLSIIDGLYDFTGNGETPTSSQGNLKLGSDNLAKLTDEQKAIATSKGWTLS